jgi:cellulose biosynthesis protein BcsQ
MMGKGTIITFYSYKGGVGRSFALSNIGAVLSKWGYKVLCVDWDLESPGLKKYFEKYIPSNNQEKNEGVVECLESFVKGNAPDWRKYVITFNLEKSKTPISLMVAGEQNESYIKRLRSLNWEDLYKNNDLGKFLEQMRTEWKKDYDLILVDSRTGVTDIGGISTIQLPDILAFFFTANYQSLDGAVDIVNRIVEEHNRLPYDRGGLITLPVFSRFDMREEYELGKEWLRIAENKLVSFYNVWVNKSIPIADIINATRIPYMSYWSFGEKLAVVEDERRDSESINYSIETLAALLAKECAETEKLIENRDSFVASISKEDMPSKKKRDINKLKLKDRCESILLEGNIFKWRRFVDELWRDIPNLLLEWKPKAERVWGKGNEERENIRLEAVEICLPSFVPIFVAVENGREDLWQESVGALRQLLMFSMGSGFTDVVEIGPQMLYIAGSIGMAIAAKTKQLDFITKWMQLPMPGMEYQGGGEKPWAEIHFAHYLWGRYMQDRFEEILKICKSDYLSGFFTDVDQLVKYLFLGNLGQSLFELGLRTKDEKWRKSIEDLDTHSFMGNLMVHPVWVLMKPEEFKAATWELFGSSDGVLKFVFPGEKGRAEKFWKWWKNWRIICSSMMGDRPFLFREANWLTLPGEPNIIK